LSMAPADSSGGNGGGRQERRRQAETEAAPGAEGADNNQPEIRSEISGNIKGCVNFHEMTSVHKKRIFTR